MQLPARLMPCPAGDGVVPHPCIGGARRLMVGDRSRQHQVLIEAVQNHTPDVLVVDEIGTAAEVSCTGGAAAAGRCKLLPC
jgi:stage III sporulation protein SpoIIIAA